MKANTSGRRARAGQSMVEFIVALVAVLTLAVGLLQLTSLMVAHTRSMERARREAGIAAVYPIAPISAPDFIRDWEPGTDTVPYSSDDEMVRSGAASMFETIFVERASTGGGWTHVARSASDRVTPLRTTLAPSAGFGMVDGSHGETVPLMPAVRSLLYDAPSIRVESTVWMTYCGGIY
jgi:hypothetical protein